MKKVHLTFDDGPHSTNTIAILNTLRERHIKATFFVLGERIKNNGKIIERMIFEGHRVGNHTYNHLNLTTLNEKDIVKQIKETEKLISAHAPVEPVIRPPYGARNGRVDNIIKSLGYSTVLWNVDTEDWKRKPDGWISHGINQIKAREKSLVLMHDIHSTTASGLSAFIDQINITGAGFVDLGDVTSLSHAGQEPSTQPENVPVNKPLYHTVAPGESLSSLSRRYYGSADKWRIIYESNLSVIANPDVIRPGMHLLIPVIKPDNP
jgi:peptidoglycan/xylan/chitin deacetylase (PgdA/CDA1 family)